MSTDNPNPTRTTTSEKAEATKDGALIDKTNEDLLIAIERQKELNSLQQQQFLLAGQLNEAYQKNLSLQTNILRQMTAQIEKDIASVNTKSDAVDILKDQVEKAEQLGLKKGIIQQIKILQEEYEKSVGDADFDPDEFIGRFEQIRAKAQDVEDFASAAEGAFSDLGSSIGVSMSIGSTQMGKMVNLISKFSTGLSSMKLEAFAATMGQFAVSAAFSLTQKALDLAFAIDDAGKKFQASTGYAKDFSAEIKIVSVGLMQAGVTASEASAAFSALSSNLSSFNPQATSANVQLATQVALMEKIGIGTSESAKSIDMFQRSLGMSQKAAADMTLQMSTMGQNIGIETKKLISDINSIMPNLLQFGNRSQQVFTDLAARAKATGIEMSKLVSIAEKFETFDEAADNTAKLNAMLGTNISTMEILTADYDEKLDILRKQIGSAVTDLSQMDRFTQKFVQQALGVGSVAEAQSLLNMSNQEYLSYKNDMEAQAKTQAELQKQAQSLVVPMEKLKLAFMKLAVVLMPLAEAIVKTIDNFSQLSTGIKIAIPLITVTALAVGNLTALQAALNHTLMITAMRVLGVIGLLYVFSELMLHGGAAGKILAGALALVTLGMIAMGKASMTSLGVFGMVIGALFGLYQLFGKRVNPLFINAFFHLALGLRFMISAMNTAGPQMLIFAAAFLLIGVGLAVVIYAFKELLSVAFQFFELAINNHEKLFMVAGGIAAIALAINFLSVSMLAGLTIAVIYFGTLGLLIASMMATGFGGGLTFSMGELTTFANAMQMIGAGMINYVQGLEKIASITSQVKASIGNGLFAATVEGGKTSVVMAGEGTLKAISASKIEVDVKIPEIKVPQTIVHVYVDGKEVSKKVKEEINEQ